MSQCKLNSPKVFMDYFHEHRKQHSTRHACIFQPRSLETAEYISYEALGQAVDQRAALLIEKGYRQRPVGLLFPTGIDFVVNFLACLQAGAIAIPLNVSKNEAQLKRTLGILADASIDSLLSTKETINTIIEQGKTIREFSNHSLIYITEEQQPEKLLPMPDILSTDLAFIQYTSGSTGDPKGVMISHNNIIENQQIIAEICEHQPGLIAGGWLPQFHDMGLIGHMLQPLYLGGTYVFMPPLNFIQRPRRWLELISTHKIASSAAPDFGYAHCLKHISEKEDLSNIDLSHWRIAFNASEPVNTQTMAAFEKRFQCCNFSQSTFFPCYGLAETTLMVSGGPPGTQWLARTLKAENDNLSKNKVSYCESGKPLVNCGRISGRLDVQIADPDTGQVMKENAIGEIWIAGASVAKGYYRKKEETAKVFYATLEDLSDKSYLRTGDLGFISAGCLYITGRLKDVLIIKGRNLYPQDIENTLNEHPHAAGYHSAAAFSLKGSENNSIAAVVEIKAKVLNTVSRISLQQELMERVFSAHGVTLSSITLLPPGTLPKTTSGKIKRHACHQLAEKKSHPSTASIVSEEKENA